MTAAVIMKRLTLSKQLRNAGLVPGLTSTSSQHPRAHCSLNLAKRRSCKVWKLTCRLGSKAGTR